MMSIMKMGSIITEFQAKPFGCRTMPNVWMQLKQQQYTLSSNDH